jgi:hypothetical protein
LMKDEFTVLRSFLTPGYLLKCFFLSFCLNYRLISGKKCRDPESGHRSHAGDFPGHRQKTRQQSARQVRREQSHCHLN